MRDETKLRAYFADAPDDISLDDVDITRIPSHVSFIMDGNKIFIRSLDLNQPFDEIRRQLDYILQTSLTSN